MEELTAPQINSYKKFLKRVENVRQPHHTDEYLLKWIKEKKFDSQKAADMFHESMAWRRKHGIDDILEVWDTPHHMKLLSTRGHVGYSKTGSPIWLVDVNGWNFKSFLTSVPTEDIVLTSIANIELMRRAMERMAEKLGRSITRAVVILDFEGLDYTIVLWKAAWKVVLRLASLISLNYPDLLDYVMFLNCAPVITIAYKALKPFLGESICNKFRIMGTDRSEWVHALLENIDEDQLPNHWGGSCVDSNGDQKCPSKACTGFKFPKSVYKNDPAILATKRLKTVTIDICSEYQFNVEILQENSTIRWVFYSDGADIAFKIHSQDTEDLLEIVNFSMVKCYFELTEGETTPLPPGKYVVTFDNSYYKLKPKSVSYSIEIGPPVTACV